MLKAGIVTFAGLPNAGKSTLLNRIVGEKLSIISPKPQSTRDRVVGIRTEGESQMVILDTPGLMAPAYALQEAMRTASLRALGDADVIVHVCDATAGPPPSLEAAAHIPSPPKAPVITALNKSDVLAAGATADATIRAEGQPDTLLVSALTGDGIPELIERIIARLPESPFLYPEDEVSTLPVRYFVAEMVRETTLELLHEEIPYSVACEVEEFREDRSPHFIRAVIYVERDSQKGIVVGAKGTMIKKIGERSRKKIETFIRQKVYLELQVKVLANWRKNPGAMARFGYHISKEKAR